MRVNSKNVVSSIFSPRLSWENAVFSAGKPDLPASVVGDGLAPGQFGGHRIKQSKVGGLGREAEKGEGTRGGDHLA
jgi:hypothetical protein